ncbi:MAG: hypothetical protein JWP89_5178 [Schlesneria sp.]|nr:hypothetical protein [Schlesneria sp.]
MTTIEKVKVNVQSLYNQLWDDWYVDLGVEKSPLVVEQGDHAPGYLDGSIYLFFDGYDLDAASEPNQHDPVAEVRFMPSWQRDLIHEMMHEYQDKVSRFSAPSKVGEALFAKYAKRFGGRGHDAWFFSAIAKHAAYFQVKPEEFVLEL